MKQALIIGILLISTHAFAAPLPGWVKNTAKATAMDQFVEWTKGSIFFNISDISMTDIVLPSGQNGVRVLITFDDSLGCKGRWHYADCTPVGQKALYCVQGMTTCGSEVRRTTTRRTLP